MKPTKSTRGNRTVAYYSHFRILKNSNADFTAEVTLEDVLLGTIEFQMDLREIGQHQINRQTTLAEKLLLAAIWVVSSRKLNSSLVRG
jgi:hypothetical protein